MDYLYAHLSSVAMARAFLLHPDMPSVLRLLVMHLVTEQIQETITQQVYGPGHILPLEKLTMHEHDLSKDELDALMLLDEPQRCYDWYSLYFPSISTFTGASFRMQIMFIAKSESELTQVDFWNLYKDTFLPFPETNLLPASEVIKNVTVVFPQAQAMVLTDPTQRFVIRGVDRRKDPLSLDRFKCQWDRSGCAHPPFKSSTQLYEHVLTHNSTSASEQEGAQLKCLWATCEHVPSSGASSLRAHILTHMSSLQFDQSAAQSATITLSDPETPFPIANPTSRPPPSLPSATVTFQQPVVDPPSSALTALLCIRILFRASFASSEAAPRADADHFGFPGIVEDPNEESDGEPDFSSGPYESGSREREGERRGRKAFVGVRKLMEGIKIRDEVLMGWINEMVDASLGGVFAT
jgi:chromatin structure-remodeling complex subunit RSC9